jgi:hypothetical protein
VAARQRISLSYDLFPAANGADTCPSGIGAAIHSRHARENFLSYSQIFPVEFQSIQMRPMVLPERSCSAAPAASSQDTVGSGGRHNQPTTLRQHPALDAKALCCNNIRIIAQMHLAALTVGANPARQCGSSEFSQHRVLQTGAR